MRVLFANDKYAGTMDATQAADAIAGGWLVARPADEARCVPMADGGPGTVSVVYTSRGGKLRSTPTINQQGRPTSAVWLEVSDSVALAESCSACGLDLVAIAERDPLHHNTRGVGRLLRIMIDEGFKEVMIGMGGTGTVDGGLGAIVEMGVEVLDDAGRPVSVGGPADYGRIVTVGGPLVLESRIQALVDVASPLLGPNGAAELYGPQKGASSSDVELLGRRLTRLADIAENHLPNGPWRDTPGAGAAGGLVFGLMAWAGASVAGGAETVGALVNLHEHIDWADVIVTGEGRIDEQTRFGKVPAFVSGLARSMGKPTLAIAGTADEKELNDFDRVELMGPDGLTDPIGSARRAATRLAAG